jgi:hypothetical protein
MGVGVQRHFPASLSPGKKTGTHFIGGWVGLKAGLEGCGKYCPHRYSIPGPSSPYQIAILTKLSRPTRMYIPYGSFVQSRFLKCIK